MTSTGTICTFGNKSSAEVRADPLLADELNIFYGRFDGGGVILPISASEVLGRVAMIL